jgi:hypothetical protein
MHLFMHIYVHIFTKAHCFPPVQTAVNAVLGGVSVLWPPPGGFPVPCLLLIKMHSLLQNVCTHSFPARIRPSRPAVLP